MKVYFVDYLAYFPILDWELYYAKNAKIAYLC